MPAIAIATVATSKQWTLHHLQKSVWAYLQAKTIPSIFSASDSNKTLSSFPTVQLLHSCLVSNVLVVSFDTSLIMKMDGFYHILRWIFDYMFWVHVWHMELPGSYAHLLHFRFFLGDSDGLIEVNKTQCYSFQFTTDSPRVASE